MSTHTLSYLAVMANPGTQVAKIHLQPSRMQDYSAYVPIQLGHLTTVAFVDSGNTFANVILPQTMTALGISPSQLELVPQLSVGTAAAGKTMKILGQAPRIDLQIGQHPAKFCIRPLVLQGLVHPVNLCGPFLTRSGIDQIHSKGVLRVCGKDVPMCPPRPTGRSPKLPPPQPTPGVCTLHVTDAPSPKKQYVPCGPLSSARVGRTPIKVMKRTRVILPLQVDPPLPTGTLVLLQPSVHSLLGDNPILQEVQPDGSLAVLADNLEPTEQELAPETLVGSVQEVAPAQTTVDPETSPPPEATTHEAFDALPQNSKIKWLVANFHLDSSPLLQRDSQLQEVIRTLLQFTDVISIGGTAKPTSSPTPSLWSRGPRRSK